MTMNHTQQRIEMMTQETLCAQWQNSKYTRSLVCQTNAGVHGRIGLLLLQKTYVYWKLVITNLHRR